MTLAASLWQIFYYWFLCKNLKMQLNLLPKKNSFFFITLSNYLILFVLFPLPFSLFYFSPLPLSLFPSFPLSLFLSFLLSFFLSSNIMAIDALLLQGECSL